MILFHYETDFILKNKKEIKKWISNCIKSEGFIVGDINYVFCNDDYLAEKNKRRAKNLAQKKKTADRHGAESRQTSTNDRRIDRGSNKPRRWRRKM